jgi:phosphoribosylamine--glycine ligase
VKLLVVGAGGREHALCWALRQESEALLWCAPGNPGTATLATNIPAAADDPATIASAVEQLDIDLTIIGPELPLALGVADHLRARGRRVFGPIASAARIEASKAFAKDVMRSAGVPTAGSTTFSDLEPALRHVEAHPEPLVVKASGLAAGKGAVVCQTRDQARTALRSMLGEGSFGEAGRTVVVEEFLEGEELSVLAITNGRDVRLLPAAQDHKRLLEGDRGPNTGGMGAYAPVTIATPALLGRVEREILLPTLAELERLGAPFRGLLYAGLMIAPDGGPWVVEFNCRFGDPEAQAVLPLVAAGLTDALWRAADGEPLPQLTIRPGAAVTTVLAAKGYPDRPEKDVPITIPDDLPADTVIFHAGTARWPDGTLVTAGGRVLAVTARRSGFTEAQVASRDAAERIRFDGKQFRRDIGWREATRAP